MKFHLRTTKAWVLGELRRRGTPKGMFKDAEGMTLGDAIAMVESGPEYYPLGECDNWDGENCLGHPDLPGEERP